MKGFNMIYKVAVLTLAAIMTITTATSQEYVSTPVQISKEKVKIDGKGRKKTITLSYEDNEDLDEILKLLCGDGFLNEI